MQIANLKIIASNKAKNQIFKNRFSIVGYPVKNKITLINTASLDKLKKIVLNTKNYANIRQRCLNKELQGIRFTQKKSIVEFIISTPCNQVIIAIKDNGKVETWGQVINQKAHKQILKILKN